MNPDLNKNEHLLIKELESQIEQIEILAGPEPNIYYYFDTAPQEILKEDLLNHRESLRINAFNKIVNNSEKSKVKN